MHPPVQSEGAASARRGDEGRSTAQDARATGEVPRDAKLKIIDAHMKAR
jgi:hypothetical protein